MLSSVRTEAKALATPRNISILAGVLIVWTCLLFVVQVLSGTVSATTPALAPLPFQHAYAHQKAPSPWHQDAHGTDILEQQWVEKLLRDLEGSASDGSVAATIAELKSTLAAREMRLASATTSIGDTAIARGTRYPVESAVGVSAETGGQVAAAVAQVEVPRYDATNVDELRKAAQTVAAPRDVKEPVPRLLRDLSDALARQKEEHDKLLSRLSKLEPQLTNYNPSDEEQLSKAAEQVVAEHGGSSTATKGGPLPRLLAHLHSALSKKTSEQQSLSKRIKL